MNSNYSVDDLLGWLSGKSRTFGWGAIVAYDRRKTNQLLNQLYIERFSGTSYLPLISESMKTGEHSYEHTTGLQLSVPKLSFHVANLNESRAGLTMDFIGGLIMSETGSPGGASFIYKIQKVLPVGGPQLSMELNLRTSTGSVVANGHVVVDISTGDKFSANFVLPGQPATAIGTRFREIFTALDPEQKVFHLGQLEGDLNGALTPDGFQLRTMAAPGAKNKASDNYGDGAVLMFVRLKGGFLGNFPGEDAGFKYLIPADQGGKEYTGTVLLANKVVMSDLIRTHVEREVGGNLKLVAESTSSELPTDLIATAGNWTVPDIDVKNDGATFLKANNLEPLLFDFDSTEPFAISLASGGLLKFSWKGTSSFLFYFYRHDVGFNPKEENSYVHFEHSMEFFLRTELDPDTGIVTFVPAPGGTSTVTVRKDPGEIALYYSFKDIFEGTVVNRLGTMHSQLSRISMPAIDTFLIRNLLFPGHNALRLQSSHSPGDVVLFGHIDRELTSATVSPSNPIIEVGGSQRFTVDPGLASLVWSVRGTEPGDTNIGSIDSSGLYKAPPPGSLPTGYQTVVVTAKGKLGTQDVTASALVSVLATTITLTPIFQVCDDNESLELSAETLQGISPTWSLANPAQGGKIDVKGKACTYTAGPQNPDLPDMFIDTVIVKNPQTNATAEAKILVLNRGIGMAVTVSEDSKPETGQVQLMLDFGEVPELPIEGEDVFTLLSGSGSISPAGLYKEASGATGFAAIGVVAGTGSRRKGGIIVLPLPLALYSDITRRVSDSLRLHSSRASRP